MITKVYYNESGSAVAATLDGLSVTIKTNGSVIQTGALTSEDQTLDEYMEMLGYRVAATVTTSMGNIKNVSIRRHWSTTLAAAMERVTMARVAADKANAELANANRAFEQAKEDAENSILGHK